MRRCVAGFGLAVWMAAASAQTVGKIAFNSVTSKSRFELANGSYDPKPVPIRGTLGLPTGGQAPYPAMVLAHGSGGIEPKDWERWVPLLNKLGVATFVVDSFTPRGITAPSTTRASWTSRATTPMRYSR